MAWLAENVEYQPLTLTDEQVVELEKALNRWMSRRMDLLYADPNFFNVENRLERLFSPENLKNDEKTIFSAFFKISSGENRENGRNDVGKNDGGIRGIHPPIETFKYDDSKEDKKDKEDKKKDKAVQAVLDTLRKHGGCLHIDRLSRYSRLGKPIIRLMAMEGYVYLDEYTDKVYLRGEAYG